MCPQNDLLFEKVVLFVIRNRSSHTDYTKNDLREGKDALVSGKSFTLLDVPRLLRGDFS